MSAGRLTLLALATVIVAAVAWWSSQRDPAPLHAPADATATAPSAAMVETGAAAAAPAATADAPTDEPERRAAPAPTGSPDPAHAVLRGRCVGADGAPLPGCTVTMSGWGANTERMDRWLRDHGKEPERIRPEPITTGADGRFEFTFWPPPPFQFSLHCKREGHGSMDGRWHTLAEGSVTDVGDVVLAAGVQVHGRVVDEQGVGKAKEYLSIERLSSPRPDGAARAATEPRWGEQVYTAADGSFRTRDWLAPGAYRLRTNTTMDVEPAQIELQAEQPLHEVTVVVRTPPKMPTIRGRVVDEAGQPVHGAQIECRSSANSSPRTSSRRDGSFELVAGQDTPPESTLVVEAAGFEPFSSDPRIAWGRTDVEFRLTRAPALTVRVTDREGAPVANFTVRIVQRNTNRWSSDDAKVRAHGPHENGTATIAGVRTGEHLLIVEFPTASGFDTLFETVQVAGPTRVDLRADTAAERSVRVVAADGQPVAGARVQLCELFGGEFGAQRLVMQRDHWLRNVGGNHALVLGDGVTGADGRVALRGPQGRTFGLQLPGPGHVPATATGFRCDAPDEFVVTVSRGARLEGRIVPAEALAELRRLAGVPPDEAFGRRRPSLQLVRERGERFPDHRTQIGLGDTPLAIGDDGTFAADGVPPGNWKVELVTVVAHGNGWSSRGVQMTDAVFVDGQTTTLRLDASALLPGVLEAQVIVNGAPLADQQVSLQAGEEWHGPVTDAQGRFVLHCRPGSYTLRTHDAIEIEALAPAIVVRGETTRHTFVVASGTVVVTVVDADDKPVSGLRLFADPPRRFLPATDQQGRVELRMPVGERRLYALPRRIMTEQDMARIDQEGRTAGRSDPFAPHRLDAGAVQAREGQTTERRIRLPPEWSR